MSPKTLIKPSQQPLEGKLARLRLLEEADLELTLKWRNQDAIRKWFLTNTVLTFDQHRNWFLDYQKRVNDYVFIIESMLHDGNPVGQISIYNIDLEKQMCEYGRLMIGDPAATGQGIAKEATCLILKFAFEVIGIDEVYLSVLADNEKAINLYRACGFLVDYQDGNILRMTLRRAKNMV